MKFKAVLFDFFGTLVPNFRLSEHSQVLEQMAIQVGAPVEPFLELWFSTFRERATGKFPDVRSNMLNICERLDISPEEDAVGNAVSTRFAYERDVIIPRPDAIATLTAIKKRGLLLGLISDCSSELPELWKDTEFHGLFDATIFSCVVGLKKPNPKIYRLACERLGVDPKECIYVGDGGSRELSGALDVGMCPVLLLDRHDQGDKDIHRVDGELWDGPCIGELNRIVTVIGGLEGEPGEVVNSE